MDSDALVDAKGDLNLSIPVMSIPGRNGLDFEVTFGYRSGIPVKQQSSWIGTGWSFDPGSITRDVRTMLQDNVAYNVDYDQAPAIQPDLYYVTSPGGKFAMTRHNTGTGSTTVPPPSTEPYEFARMEWRPWRIEYKTGYLDFGSTNHVACICTQVIAPSSGGTIAKDDIISWTLTDESGRRYVFAHPTLDSFRGLYSAQNLHSMEYYVSSWRLIAVLGTDYDGQVPSQPDDLNHNSPGSWVKFEYSDPAVVSYNDTELTGFGAVKQAAYLTAIETPTHRAEFITSPKEVTEEWPVVWEGGLSSIYKQLTRIRLYTLAGGQAETIVKEVVLDHSGSIEGFGSTARLALDEIRTYGVGGENGAVEVPGYRFTYYGTSGGAVDDYYDDLDDFGYYNQWGYNSIATDTLDGASWNLETITHPVGYVEEFVYSNDEICNYCGSGLPGDYVYYIPYTEYTRFPDEIQYTTKNLSISSTRTRQGGSRLLQINRYETADAEVYSTTRYQYQGGRVSGIPPAFLDRQYTSTFFKNVNRGQAAVFYNRVKRINPDDTWTETYYTTDLSHPGTVTPIRTAVYQHNSDKLVITGNEDLLWGRQYRIVSSEGASRETDLEENLSVARLSEMVNLLGMEYSTFWINAGQILTKVEKRYVAGSLSVGGYITKTTEVDYSQDTGLPATITTHRTGLDPRVTELTYAADIPEYSWAAERNMLSQIARVDNSVLLDDGAREYFNAEVSQWGVQDISGDGVSYSIPYLRTKLKWRSANTSTSKASFDSWSSDDASSEDWLTDDVVLEVDEYGNAVSLLDVNGARTNYTYVANNSLLSEIHSFSDSGSPAEVIVDMFSGAGVPDGWQHSGNGGDIIQQEGVLKVPVSDTELNSGTPYIQRDLQTGYARPFVVELDIIVPDEADREVYISLGGSNWTTDPEADGSAVWISFTETQLRVFDRRKWRSGEIGIERGRAVRVLIESDPEIGASTFRINGQTAYSTTSYISDVSEVKTIAIGVFEAIEDGSAWYVDNIRMYPADELVSTIEYDTLFLRPVTTIDESGIVERYGYDYNGRLARKYTSGYERNERISYQMSRSANTDDFDVGAPNVVSTRLYSDTEAPSLGSRNGWLTAGSATFGEIERGRLAGRLGDTPSGWSWIRYDDIDSETTAEVDVYIDGSLAGVPHIISFIGTGQTFAIRYNGSNGNLCISYSNTTYSWTWSCWNNFDVESGQWYTARIASRMGGWMDAQVSRADDPSIVSSIKSVGGYDLDSIAFVRSMAKEDELLLADFYVGNVTAKVSYLDAFGRSEQELVKNNSAGAVRAISYDIMDREVKRYLPVPETEYVSDIESTVESYYTNQYVGETIWPYAETIYDGLGRVSRQYPVQSGADRVAQVMSYNGEFFDTTLANESGALVDVATTTSVNGNITSIVNDALERTILKRIPVRRPVDGIFPENRVLVASRSMGTFQAGDDGYVPPTDIDFNDWMYDSYSLIADRSYLIEFSIEIDVQGSGDAYVVMKKDGSTEKLWTFDNSQSPTRHNGVLPVYDGHEYEFEVAAGVSESPEYPGTTFAELNLSFTNDDSYLAFNETRFEYDNNDNLVSVQNPECFSNPDLCDPDSGTWRVLSHYNTASQKLARSGPEADGDGDGDPTNELVGADADYRYKYFGSGLVRFSEDPNLRNQPRDGLHVRSYDSFGRITDYGTYDGKYSFDFLEPGDWANMLFDVAGTHSYSGGRMRESVYDSTVYAYGYDARGNITEVAVTIPDLPDKVIRYDYDRLGNVTRVAYATAEWNQQIESDLFVQWYEYDALGRLKQVSSSSSDDISAASTEFTYEYNVSGAPVRIVIGDGSVETIDYAYDLAGRLTGINDLEDEESGVFAQTLGYSEADEIALSSGQTIDFQPRYDGNVSWMAWRTSGNVDGGAIGGYTFQYDELNRIKRADFGKRYGLASAWSASSRYDVNAQTSDSPIIYDADGNVISLRRYSETGVGNTAVYNYDQPGSGLLSSIVGSRDFTYDFNGNLTADGADISSIEYDERNMPVVLETGDASHRYRFDSGGLRVQKIGPTGRHYIRGKDGTVVAVINADGSLQKWNIIASGSVVGYAVP